MSHNSFSTTLHTQHVQFKFMKSLIASFTINKSFLLSNQFCYFFQSQFFTNETFLDASNICCNDFSLTDDSQDYSDEQHLLEMLGWLRMMVGLQLDQIHAFGANNFSLTVCHVINCYYSQQSFYWQCCFRSETKKNIYHHCYISDR